jgi:hypothetical protein
MTQAPETHWTAGEVAVGLTCGRDVQLWPQAPQLFTSVVRFTHWLPQTIGVEPPQLGRQLAGCVCSEQIGVDPPQVRAQLPQCADVARDDSHPSSGRLEQCAYPEVHAEGGT